MDDPKCYYKFIFTYMKISLTDRIALTIPRIHTLGLDS